VAANRLLRTAVYGVTLRDPPTYVSLAVTLTAVVLAACLLPALRVSHLDPARALTHD
jgi:ABC-type lipoprotein release transport system permease subunit